MDTILFVFSKLFWLALRPNTLALLLSLLGLALMWRHRRSRGRWLLLLGLGYYLLVLATPLSQWLVLPLEDRFSRPATPPERVDGIIVLGGAVEQLLTQERGIPALNGAAERMTEPVILLRRYPTARLVFTGGSPALVADGPTESDVARQLWTAMGIPAERLVFEDEARNTHENGVLTQRLVQPQPGETWLLVTSASHMPRAMGVFQRIGWPVVAWPVNYSTGHSWAAWYDAPFGHRMALAEWGFREWTGLVAYWLLGRTSALLPGPEHRPQ